MSGEDALISNEKRDLIGICFKYAENETLLFDFMATIATMLDVFAHTHDLTLEEDSEIFNTIERMRKARYAEDGQF